MADKKGENVFLWLMASLPISDEPQQSLTYRPRKPLLDTKEALLTDQLRLTDRPIKLRTMFGVIQIEVYG